MIETKDALVIVAVLCRGCDITYVTKLNQEVRCEKCRKELITKGDER